METQSDSLSDMGLTRAEVRERMERGQSNVTKSEAENIPQILLRNFCTPFNLLNIALAICLLLVGSYRNMLFMLVVLSNALIGTVQEIRVHHAIRRLKLLHAPIVTVLREGTQERIPAENLVKDDLIILRGGDQIPADAVVSEGIGSVNESLLTGESDAVAKAVGDWLMSGSYVLEGRFVARLVRVGDDSYAAQLVRKARKIKRPKSRLMEETNRLIRFISAMLIPVGILLFCKQYFWSDIPLSSAVTGSVAAMVGMIPEGLILLTSTAMMLGVLRLGKRQALVQELNGIETLAQADVLCLDKTGTLTTGNMSLDHALPIDVSESEFQSAWTRFLGAFDCTSGTLGALAENREILPSHPIAVLPFSSQRKKSAAAFDDTSVLILGAPNFVLGQEYDRIAETVEVAAAQGSRVLVLARASGAIVGGELPRVNAILGLFFLVDTLRENVGQTLAYFARQDVALKIISGDDPRTVSNIARRAGISGCESWTDASAWKDDADLERAATQYTVFGRVTPEQKQKLVEALKRAGHNVAMTGDGVNDIPALKAADCSIAMADGSDAAKHAAQISLTQTDFSALPEIVAEGRRVMNNVTRAATLFLTKTLYACALSMLMLFLPGRYPFQPIQLTLVSSMTIGIPAFLLSLEKNTERSTGHFLRKALLQALPCAAATAVCAAAAVIFGKFGWDSAKCSTWATLSAGFMGLVNLTRACMPMTKIRAALLCAMAAGFASAITFFPKVFFLAPLSGWEWAILGGMLLLGSGIAWILSKISQKRMEKHL